MRSSQKWIVWLQIPGRGEPLVPKLVIAGAGGGEGHGNPLHYSCLENPHKQGSLVGYSPWGHQELDMTEVT